MGSIWTLFEDMTHVHAGRRMSACAASEIDKVVVIGSSGTGKTSTVNYIRTKTDLMQTGRILVPKRYITRQARQNDDLIENQYVTSEEFGILIAQNKVDVSWKRDLGGQDKEQYGFESTESNIMKLYSANMAMVKSGSALIPSDFLDNALIVGLYTDEELRLERLQIRSPDILNREAEIRIRLSDKTEQAFDYAHLVINNNQPKDIAGHALQQIVEKLVL